MTPQPPRTHGRAASLGHVPGEHPGRTDYDLVRRLRSVREGGDEAMTAAERYDPDVCLHLSACATEAEVDQALAGWLDRRLAVLKRTSGELRRVWAVARRPVPRSDSAA